MGLVLCSVQWQTASGQNRTDKRLIITLKTEICFRNVQPYSINYHLYLYITIIKHARKVPWERQHAVQHKSSFSFRCMHLKDPEWKSESQNLSGRKLFREAPGFKTWLWKTASETSFQMCADTGKGLAEVSLKNRRKRKKKSQKEHFQMQIWEFQHCLDFEEQRSHKEIYTKARTSLGKSQWRKTIAPGSEAYSAY